MAICKSGGRFSPDMESADHEKGSRRQLDVRLLSSEDWKASWYKFDTRFVLCYHIGTI